MSINLVYNAVKKQNGEAFMQTLRNYDDGIFEIPNIVDVLKYAGRDAEPIKPILEYLKNKNIVVFISSKNPFDLLKEAGYDAFYADTLKKQNSIRRFFAPGEELCTFNDIRRYQTHYIVHCVKKGAEKLKRSHFLHPKRDDEYAKSVISIQISKCGGFLKICNRYNHAVSYPDNTFYSNPDNIIQGLSYALQNYFGVQVYSNFQMPNNFILVDGKIVRYHTEMLGSFFGDNVYVKKGEVVPINKDYQMLIGPYLLDLQKKCFFSLLDTDKDEFVEVMNEEIRGKILQVKSTQKGKFRSLFVDGIKVLETKDSELHYLYLPTTKKIKDRFLMMDNSLTYFFAPHLQSVGDRFLEMNKKIKHIYFPRLVQVGSFFFAYSDNIQSINLPLLKKVGFSSLKYANVDKIILPSLRTCQDKFLSENKRLEVLSAPKLVYAYEGFLESNRKLCRFYAPNFSHYVHVCDMLNPVSDKLHFSENVRQKRLLQHKSDRTYFLSKQTVSEKIFAAFKEFLRI